MAIFIRTGANGSYKSAHVVYFTIFEALKAGRVVVTNIEGMEPLEVIEQRFDIKFPSTTRLLRIFSRDLKGKELWQYFFCWCPIGSLIVIDECQDIFSKNIGFRMEKVFYRPLSDFLPHLPPDFENLFNSRHTPVDITKLLPSEVDDRGVAEYDSEGRIIYPQSFNEGFMRHRKYNWDIHLLSPDWGQIDTAIRACAEECYFHKGRDAYFFTKRKPYIYRHPKNVATLVIPKGKDPNVFTQKIPLEAHLLYKSTSTGKATQSGAINMLFKNPTILGSLILGVGSIGYFIYALSGLVFGSSETVQESSAQTSSISASQSSTELSQTSTKNAPSLPSSGDGNQAPNVSVTPANRIDSIKQMLGLYDLQTLYYTGHVTRQTKNSFQFFVTLEAKTPEGTYYLDDTFLRANDIAYVHYDDCLLKLTKENITINVTCKPILREAQPNANQPQQVKIGSIF
ncbi:TPA: zonular occludens toxin domain-containing protein [Vibrio cholerae]|uniref:zonular occludens toxin domain-containing protein n=1 Tax=Vibrio cholerae TaxID=666 RepID=UPI000615E38F|nr:zonular occludens toxin domain-containing protein [Vibrio cholerae]AKB04686.1 zonular occludens toxin family protein [Vibrio cholerae]EGR2420420.1 toxin [Vibrio cholerae]EKF9081048.1 toxin [Vibrio cholerae]ELT7226373.1 toxin [Vibrio cholerae]MCX9469154.1 toxin [Vibrio cholerae]